MALPATSLRDAMQRRMDALEAKLDLILAAMNGKYTAATPPPTKSPKE